MAENRDAIEISVVIAAPDGGPGLARCLEALREQVSPVDGEILVVHDPALTNDRRRPTHSATARWIPLPAGAEVPNLWQAGIEASRGKIVALLVESCVPNPDWIDQVLRLHRSEVPVIGGAIDLSPDSSFLDSAVYFCRYSRYMPPFAAQYLDDLPGTNCSYKRATLEGLQEEISDGFWETFIHEKLRNRGDHLLCDPNILVRYSGSTSGLSFLRTRFAHGRKFAARRATGLNWRQRTLRALAFPLVPVLMLRRIAGRVWARRTYRARFMACAPLVTVFLTAWSAGESLGYVFGPSLRTRGADERRSRVLGRVP